MAKTPSINPVEFVVRFWQYVEQHCTHKGATTTDRVHYGLRIEDDVELTIDGVLHKTTVQGLFRAISTKAGVNIDLALSSRQAVATRQLLSYTFRGKKGTKTEGRIYGTSFWTPSNERYKVAKPARKNTLVNAVPSLLG